VNSKAYWGLKGVATQYLSVFLGKRQMKYVKAERTWVIRNNGKIVFPYKEAESRFGISPGRHKRALRELHAKGFIDINHLGGGMDGDCTTFSISKRWKQYGSPDFKLKVWPKDMRKRGNPKIKDYGRGRQIKYNYH